MGEGLHVLAHAAARPLGVRAQHGGLDDALRVRVRVRVRVRARARVSVRARVRVRVPEP